MKAFLLIFQEKCPRKAPHIWKSIYRLGHKSAVLLYAQYSFGYKMNLFPILLILPFLLLNAFKIYYLEQKIVSFLCHKKFFGVLRKKTMKLKM